MQYVAAAADMEHKDCNESGTLDTNSDSNITGIAKEKAVLHAGKG